MGDFGVCGEDVAELGEGEVDRGDVNVSNFEENLFSTPTGGRALGLLESFSSDSVAEIVETNAIKNNANSKTCRIITP